jgi:hypothetical protein
MSVFKLLCVLRGESLMNKAEKGEVKKRNREMEKKNLQSNEDKKD